MAALYRARLVPFQVANYAGRHKQYAAATTKDGVPYQNVWSSQVRYGPTSDPAASGRSRATLTVTA